jgi:hypothetical protein
MIAKSVGCKVQTRKSMRGLSIGSLGILVLLLSLTAAQAQKTAAGSGGMHRVSMNDALFGMTAYTLEIPNGWQFESNLRRDVGCSPGDPFQAYRVTSPDGSIRFQVMTPFFTAYPAQMIQGMDFSQCGVITPSMPTAQLLTRYIVPAIRKDVQVGTPEPTEDTAQWKQQNARQMQVSSTSGDASRVKVTYTENGKAFEEWIIGMTQTTTFRQGGGGFSKTIVITMRAPAGHLADVQREVKWAANAQANPEWVQREQQRMQQATAEAQANGQRTRDQIAAQARRNMDATKARTQQTIDGIHATGKASMDAARNNENARHASAVGTADYVGDRPTTYYRWRNTVTGATQTTNNPTVPGPNWVAY